MWREESNFKPEKERAEKEFLKVGKKIRDILKIEQQAGGPEANQMNKIKNKDVLITELMAIENIGFQVWDRNKDLWMALTSTDRKELEAAYKEERESAQAKKEADFARRMANRIEPATEDRKRNVTVEFVPRHERPVTDLCYVEPFLYSTSKDKNVLRWDISGENSRNGGLECATTLCGHEGAVWCCDNQVETQTLVSGGADGLICFWDLKSFTDEKTQTPKDTVNYGGLIKMLRISREGAENSKICLFTDKFGASPARLQMLSYPKCEVIWRCDAGVDALQFPTMNLKLGKLNMLMWAPVGKPKVFTCHDDGHLAIWGADADADSVSKGDLPPKAKMMKAIKPHDSAIISMNTHKHFILTASTDMSVKAIACNSPQLPVAYSAVGNRPLRSVAAHDFTEKKCFGFLYAGGREPREVTTSTLLADEFEIFQNYFGNYTNKAKTSRAHVGPIHRLMWIPELEKFFSAAEDGDVKMWGEGGLDGSIQQMRN